MTAPFENDPRLKESFRRIVDVITCADGGIEFFKFRTLLERLSAQAQEGDTAAAHLLDQVHIFRRLLDAAQR